MSNDLQPTDFTPSRKLNFVIGICAMLVSVASFYATYLQANSAEQQVKAMTYPLIQYTTGNYSLDLKESAISLKLNNAGVGPAIIKRVNLKYNNKSYRRLEEFLVACCGESYNKFKSPQETVAASIESRLLTSFVEGSILSAGDNTNLLTLRRRPENKEFWEVLNRERFKLSLEVCYCSLLDSCYVSERAGLVTELKSCEV